MTRLQKTEQLYDGKSEHSDTRKIEKVQSILMPYLQSVETEREKVDELIENDIGDILDSALLRPGRCAPWPCRS